MKFANFYLLVLTIIGISIQGMEKPFSESPAWKRWLLSKWSSQEKVTQEKLLPDLLPSELRNELIKFITHNKMSVRNFWMFKHAQYHQFNKKKLPGHTHKPIHYDKAGMNYLITALAYDLQNNLLFSAGLDGVIKVWDLIKNKCIAQIWATQICSMVKYNNYLYAGSDDGLIKILDLNLHKHTQSLTGHTHRVTSLICNADRNQLYSACIAGIIKVWDLTNNTCIATLSGHMGNVNALAYDAKAHILYSASSDKTIKSWDLNTRSCIATLKSNDSIYALAYNPNANQLYYASIDDIKIWNLNTKSCITHLKSSIGQIRELMYDSENHLLYSIGEHNLIKIWDTDTYNYLDTLKGHKNPIRLASDFKTHTLYISSTDSAFVDTEPQCTIKILALEDPLLAQEIEKANIWQWLALQKSYECANAHKPLDARTFALLNHGPAQLEALKKVIKKKVSIK